jgi:superkiller protein 3
MTPAYYDRARALYQLGRFDEALAATDGAVHLDSGDPQVWVLRGNILNKLNKVAELIQSADRALALDKNNPAALKLKAGGLGKLGRHEEALACLDEAARLGDPKAAIVANSVRQSLQCFPVKVKHIPRA